MKKNVSNFSFTNLVERLFILVVFLLTVGCNSSKKVEYEIRTTELPKFSKEGGFFSNNFNLALSSELGNAIYYTLDGSDPRFSKTAKKYKKEISIYNNSNEPNIYSALKDVTLNEYNPPEFNVEKGIIVRAVIKDKKLGFGQTVENSYFVGKTAPYYSQMRVISMVTDAKYLFDQDKGAYMIGSKYYEWKNSDSYQEYHPGDVLNVTNYNSDGKENEFPVCIQVFEKGKSVYSTKVGARIAGNWSRSNAQKSFRFYARKEYGNKSMDYEFFDELKDANGNQINSFDKITLRNGGNDSSEVRIRDPLIHNLVSDLSCDIMASEPCILFINGEFWGFYMIREKTDGEYIKSHYGIKKKNVAVLKNSQIEEGGVEDLDEFRHFCVWAARADMTDKENYKTFCDLMDVQSFMDYMAVQTYINNFDWVKNYTNNWQIWHSKSIEPNVHKADNKWRFIFYDTEYSSGIYNQEDTHYEYDLLNKMYLEKDEKFNFVDMLRNLCKNQEFLQAFYDNYLNIIENNFDPNKVIKIIDEYMAEYKKAIMDTYFRFGLTWMKYNFDPEIEDLKTFYQKRPEYAKKYLDIFYETHKK